MNAAAIGVLKELPDISIAYGISDEYRSVIGNLTTLSMMGLFAFSALSSIALVVYSIDEKGNLIAALPIRFHTHYSLAWTEP